MVFHVVNFIPKNIHNGINNKDNTEKNTDLPFDPLSSYYICFHRCKKRGQGGITTINVWVNFWL